MHETEKWVIDEIERMHSEINRMIREIVSAAGKDVFARHEGRAAAPEQKMGFDPAGVLTYQDENRRGHGFHGRFNHVRH